MLPDTSVASASCTSGPGTGPLAEIAQITERMRVGLTEAAARHIQRYIGRRGKGVGVRLGVKTTGCSGLAYKIEFADDVEPEDIIFEQLGVKILVDPKSLPYIDGTELDFVREGLNEGFKFNNPNERDRCGCGESFRI
jgi:iron-sulfur cluster assembly protein